jgi:hypothetical protein
VFVFPIRNAARTLNPPMRVEVCARNGDKRVPVASAVATNLGTDLTRIKEAIILPWSALGMAGPPRDGNLRIQLGATSFYRSRWMSLTGESPALAIDDYATWRSARLHFPTTPEGNLISIDFREPWEPRYRAIGRRCCLK